MDKETWFGKTGLVMHEGFLMRTGKGATTKKRKWCKLLFDAKNNTAWIIYLHIDDTQLKDADSDTIHDEIKQRALYSKSRSEIYPGFMRAEGIIPISEMEKLILVSEDQFELHSSSKSSSNKVWCLKVDEDDLYDWYINIIACVPKLVHEAEKEKLPGKLFGKAPNQYAVSMIGDTKYFPQNCYAITHTWTQGGAGKIRTAMKVSGGDELFGVKELRTVAKSGAVQSP